MNLDLRFYWRLLLRRLPAMAALFLICSGVGVAMSVNLPSVYVSSAKLLVETQQVSEGLAPSTVNIDPREQLEIIRQRLMTRANLVEIANDLDVFENRSQLSADTVVDMMRNQTSMRATGEPLLMYISFESGRPQVAANVVNKYVTLILNANAEFRTGVAEQTREFFEQDVERLNSELSIQSEKILNFKNENAEALPDTEPYNRSRQVTLQQQKTLLERQIDDLRAQRERFVEVFERTGRLALQDAQLSPQQQRLEALNSELEEALVLYSPTNPKIRLLQAQISRLESEIAAEQGGSEDATKDAQAQLFEVSISEVDGRLTSAQTELDDVNAELDKLSKILLLTPQNAIALESLERDYEAIANQYNSAIARLAQATMGNRIEDSQRGQRVSLIEPATVPASPTRPNRKRIAAMGIAGGLALAGGFFVLLELLNRTVRRPVELERAMGVTPLVTIPFMESARRTIIRRSLRIGLLLLVLIGLPAIVWAIDTYYMPIPLLVEKIGSKLGL